MFKLAQLRSQLPEAAKNLFTGVQEPAEAWKLLDKRYGDKHIVVLSVMHKLQSVKLPHRRESGRQQHGGCGAEGASAQKDGDNGSAQFRHQSEHGPA